MNRTLDTTEYLEAVIALLDEGHENIPVPVTGTSMCPFLHPGDTVYLCRCNCAFHPGDVVLYRRNEGSFVLHRIHRMGKHGIVWITGDNQTALEAVDSQKQIMAIVSSVNRKGRLLTHSSLIWLFYSSVWRWLRPLRPLLGKLHHITKAR